MSWARLGALRAAAVALAFGAVGSLAGAGQTRGRLFVARSEQAMDCPDTAALSAMVEALMGRPALSASGAPPDVELNVQIARDSAGYRATVRASGASAGVRELTDAGPGCGELADALAVTLAVLLDWKGPPAASASASASASAPASASASAPAPPAPRRWAFGASLGGGLAAGVLPELAPFASLDLEARAGKALRLGLGGFWLPQQSRSLAGGAVRTSYAGGQVIGCVPFALGQAELAPCGALAVGWFEAQGDHFDSNTSASRLWLAPGLGAEGRGPLLGRLGWSLRAMGHLPHRPQKVSVRGADTIDLPRAGVFVRLALVVALF